MVGAHFSLNSLLFLSDVLHCYYSFFFLSMFLPYSYREGFLNETDLTSAWEFTGQYTASHTHVWKKREGWELASTRKIKRSHQLNDLEQRYATKIHHIMILQRCPSSPVIVLARYPWLKPRNDEILPRTIISKSWYQRRAIKLAQC